MISVELPISIKILLTLKFVVFLSTTRGSSWGVFNFVRSNSLTTTLGNGLAFAWLVSHGQVP